MIYPIEDSEMESLADINNNVAFWSAFGGGGVTVILGCTWDIISVGVENASRSQWGFLAIGIGATAFAFIVAWRYRARGSARLDKIRSQSQTVKI